MVYSLNREVFKICFIIFFSFFFAKLLWIQNNVVSLHRN